jgi:hypothetical protein
LSLRTGGSGGWRRPLAAGLLLLAVYVGLSFLNSPRGFLGTDTGGKVATLRVMAESGRFDPDLGYWAEEWDPDGRFHPLSNTSHFASGAWVNVTTLPALWLGWYLFDLGGYRAALLVPMAGSIAACFAGLALLRRLGASERHAWHGCLLLGLGSPLAVYALDFWEHSLGVALAGWAAVLLVDVVAARRPAGPAAAGAGLLLGAAATMRTEALVYLGVAGLVLVAFLLRRNTIQAVRSGAAMLIAAAVPVGANELVERRVIGDAVRSGRVVGTALGVGAEPTTRLEEALTTVLALEGTPRGVVLGALAVTLLGFAAARRDLTVSLVALAGAGAVGVLRFVSSGLGFVPGLGPAWVTPAAATAGLSLVGRRRRAEPPPEAGTRTPDWPPTAIVPAVALAAIPLVVLTQFVGGAGPQWAGRYLLVSGFLLAVVGWAALERCPAALRAAFAVLACAVTGLGVWWLHERSHAVADTFRTLEARPEPVLVSDVYFFVREGGATYGDRRWLTLPPAGEAADVVEVLDGAEVDRFAAVQLDGARPLRFPGFEPAAAPADVRLFDGVDLTVTPYRRTG